MEEGKVNRVYLEHRKGSGSLGMMEKSGMNGNEKLARGESCTRVQSWTSHNC